MRRIFVFLSEDESTSLMSILTNGNSHWLQELFVMTIYCWKSKYLATSPCPPLTADLCKCYYSPYLLTAAINNVICLKSVPSWTVHMYSQGPVIYQLFRFISQITKLPRKDQIFKRLFITSINLFLSNDVLEHVSAVHPKSKQFCVSSSYELFFFCCLLLSSPFE